MLDLLIVEDNPRLAAALQTGFTATGQVAVLHTCATGEEALAWCLAQSAAGAPRPAAVLMDVQLAGAMNGVQTAVALRREFPRLPVVFYSIQDDAPVLSRLPRRRHPQPLRLRPQVQLPAP